MALPTREEALELLKKHVKDDYQILHSKMVAAAMAAYANKYNEDEDLWYITGLLHDIDYYEYPNEHPAKSLEWFKEWDYPGELIHAVEAHALGYNGFETKAETLIAKALMACDEMCGLLHAYSLMRPTGYEGMKVKSVKKKFKDKAFAAKLSREEMQFGMDQLEIEFADHVNLLIEAVKGVS